MKILFVAHGFPPSSSRGAELYALRTLQLLNKEHDVHVFFAKQDFGKPENEIERGHYRDIAYTCINRTGLQIESLEDTCFDKKVESAFVQLLDRLQPEIVHFQHLSSLSLRLPELAKKQQTSVFMTLHDYHLICPQGQMLRRDLAPCRQVDLSKCETCRIRYFKPGMARLNFLGGLEFLFHLAMKWPLFNFLAWSANQIFDKSIKQKEIAKSLLLKREHTVYDLVKCVDRFVLPSQMLFNVFSNWGMPREKMTVMGYGFNNSLIGDSRKNPSVKIRFGFLGSLIPSKGVHHLLQAASAYREAEFHIWGTAPQPYEGYPYYAGLLQSFHNRKHIHFHGEYDQDNIQEMMRDIDVLVVPSLWSENMPLTIQEAMLSGTPVITADFGGMSELIKHEETGLLYSRGSVKGLRQALRRMIFDRALRQRMRENLIRFADALRFGTSNKVLSGERDGFETMSDHVKRLEQMYAHYYRKNAFDSSVPNESIMT